MEVIRFFFNVFYSQFFSIQNFFFVFLLAFQMQDTSKKILCPDDETITWIYLELRLAQIRSVALHQTVNPAQRNEAIRLFQCGAVNIIILNYNDPAAQLLRDSDYTYWFETPAHWGSLFMRHFCHLRSIIKLMPQGDDELYRTTFAVAIDCLAVSLKNILSLYSTVLHACVFYCIFRIENEFPLTLWNSSHHWNFVQDGEKSTASHVPGITWANLSLIRVKTPVKLTIVSWLQVQVTPSWLMKIKNFAAFSILTIF